MRPILHFIVLIALCTLASCTTKNNDKAKDYDFVERYGFDYNKVRIENRIPIIEKNWKLLELDSTYLHWSHPERRVNQLNPFHLKKTTFISKGTIVYEEDAIHYEGETNRHYRLIMSSYINAKLDKLDSAKYNMITYFDSQYPPSIMTSLSKSQVDSVVSKWGIIY